MERKTKILLISNLYPSKKTPHYGSFVKNFEEQLIQDNRISSLKGVFLKGIHGSLINKLFSYIGFYLKIFHYALFHKYDIIYVHLITHSTLPLRLVNYVKPLPLIFNIHGEDLLVTTPLAKKLLQLALPLVKKAKFIVVPSHYFKRITIKQIPDYPTEKIIISASGGVKDIFKPVEKTKLKKVEFIIGYVSRIDRGKGWDTLLEAVRILINEDIRVHIRIVGGGPQKDRMLNTIKEYGISDYVEYVGPIAHDDLPEFYQGLDLFIFPTKLRESLGLVGIEAMACGVPVIGSNIGGLTDYLIPNYNGYFFTPGEPKELSDKVKKYIALSEHEKNRFKEAALLTSSRYSEKIVSQKLFNTIL